MPEQWLRPASAGVVIRPYHERDEQSWLRCSVLSFLNTAYFDSVFRQKPRYEHPAIELVAELDGEIVGVVDVECEETPNSVCTVCAEAAGVGLGAMIWHLAVHPDYQGRGIGTGLLSAAQSRAVVLGIACFEVWTRDDEDTLRWYQSRGFEWVKSYLHVYLEGKEEMTGMMQSLAEGLTPVHLFAHYTGADRDAIRARFRRVHECNCFRLRL